MKELIQNNQTAIKQIGSDLQALKIEAWQQNKLLTLIEHKINRLEIRLRNHIESQEGHKI